MSFPFKWTYRKRAPSQPVRNKKEAILQTLAHEFYHIECWVLRRNIYFEEVEAEKCANIIFSEYKRAISNRSQAK